MGSMAFYVSHVGPTCPRLELLIYCTFWFLDAKEGKVVLKKGIGEFELVHIFASSLLSRFRWQGCFHKPQNVENC